MYPTWANLNARIKRRMDEALVKDAKSIAAPLKFFIVGGFQFLSQYVELQKTKASISDKYAKLKAEIMQLMQEANALSQPSTFVQTAKLKRTVATMEKELAKNKRIHREEIKSPTICTQSSC
ncbi:unnamed protein product [Cuscuta europaea]|uniref:Uncharacterized protein n=1 Tax=Cuscuta europaea TaxID=41803 RepID=A0A9P1E114_CUSEU|nr:unnamed protein product [Cuscuta europaea]